MSHSFAMTTWLSYLRVPFLASSAFATLGTGLLYFKQNEIIYPRNMPAGSRAGEPTPRDFGIENAESIHLPTPDGETLHAYILHPKPSQPRKPITVLCFHGNAGNIGHRLPIGRVISDSLGCTAFMLEYRGYGLSTGDPDECGLTIDAQTALNYIRKSPDFKNTKLVVYGQSLGGAVAIKLVEANQHRGDIKGLILENTFTSIRNMIPSIVPMAKYFVRLCHQYWTSEEVLPKIAADIPVLFLSGLKDEIVPPRMMKVLFDISKAERKVWKAFPNGDHNATVAQPGYFDSIWNFIIEEVMHDKNQKGTLDFEQAEVDPDWSWN